MNHPARCVWFDGRTAPAGTGRRTAARWPRVFGGFVLALVLGLGLAPAAGEPSDTSSLEVTEAFPGALLNLDAREALTGGITNNGSSEKGNTCANKKGWMATTWASHAKETTGAVVVARTTDGKKWVKHELTAAMDNALGTIGGLGTLMVAYAGLGPQVQLDEEGNACLVVVGAEALHTYWWAADATGLKEADRLERGMPVTRCGVIKLEKDTYLFQTYQHRNQFFVLTMGQRGATVYQLEKAQHWRKLAEPLASRSATLAWDPTTGELYLAVIAERSQQRGCYPAVYRLDPKTSQWRELANPPAEGLQETYGVTSYLGAATVCPALVAHNGTLWCFWSQAHPPAYPEGNLLQGAVYREGRWQSCAKSLVRVSQDGLDDQMQERPSLGPGGFLLRGLGDGGTLPARSLFAFRMPEDGSLVVLHARYNYIDGVRIKEGRGEPVAFYRQRTLPLAKMEWFLLENFFNGPAFRILAPDGLRPHSLSMEQAGNNILIHATGIPSYTGAQGPDVFVYKLTPHPVRRFGAQLAAARSQAASDLTQSTQGPVVTKVLAKSVAEKAGLQVGDVVTQVGTLQTGRQNWDLDCWYMNLALRFAPAGDVPIVVERQGRPVTLTAKFE